MPTPSPGLTLKSGATSVLAHTEQPAKEEGGDGKRGRAKPKPKPKPACGADPKTKPIPKAKTAIQEATTVFHLN